MSSCLINPSLNITIIFSLRNNGEPLGSFGYEIFDYFGDSFYERTFGDGVVILCCWTCIGLASNYSALSKLFH